MLIRGRSTRVSQPTGPVEIDTSNPSTLDLVSLPLFSSGASDTARQFTPRLDAGVTQVASEYGRALRGTTASDGFNLTAGTGFNGLIPTTSQFTVMMLVRVATIGARRIFLADFNTAGTTESICMEQQAANTWRFYQADSSGSALASTGGTVSVGWHWVEFGWNGSAVQGVVDAVPLTSATATNPRRNGSDLRALRAGAATVLSFDGDVAFIGIWRRFVSDVERIQIRENPWALYRPAERRVWLSDVAGGGGGVNVTANGATITATASISTAGAASAVQSPTVAGQVINATASLIAGMASAAANATVNGVTMAVTATLQAGTASAVGAATVAGQALTAIASIISGAASAVANVSAGGTTLSATASLIPGEAYVAGAGGGSGGWPKIGMKLSLGM